MDEDGDEEQEGLLTSMGPRSDNRGYARPVASMAVRRWRLQWVHGPITVVMDFASNAGDILHRTSMGPRSDNRGYGQQQFVDIAGLQTSMGPRSDNRGYGPVPAAEAAAAVRPRTMLATAAARITEKARIALASGW